ncbi:MAG: aromatic amino acid ammonia-lyase [Bacteroidales bacterium]|nr:aromatic amino acid ammonia-lyase [Bacteroidales bacterium]
MQYSDIEDILFNNKPLRVPEETKRRIAESHAFLKEFAKDKVIYGINTGFGPMAQYRVKDEDVRALQYNIIRSHSCGAGEPFSEIYVRAAMLARYFTFASGKSGVDPYALDLLQEFINKGIYPVIPQHGSVGASGDLVQLAHLALALIGEGEVFYQGRRRHTAEVMSELHITPLKPSIREGLALNNGTAMMTGLGIVNLHYAKKLLQYAIVASVMMNEIASSYDDFMAPELNDLKNHEGQSAVARLMLKVAQGSHSLRKRQVEMFHRHEEKVFEHKVQPYYSLRCVPQILGPIYEAMQFTEKILLEEFNGVDDNPIVDMETQTVYHGGNFHGDYVSFEMDKLRIALTKATMLMERQLNYLCHDRINGILPPFLNLGSLGLNYGIQAMQFTATSTTAECQTLSNSMYVHSIPNNNDNQDIVSMGTNSGLLTKRVVENAFQVMAIHYIALAQAVDCLEMADQLSPFTQEIYKEVRAIVPKFIEDTPKNKDIQNVIDYLTTKEINIL